MEFITLSRGGSRKRRVPITSIEIPDLWPIAMCHSDMATYPDHVLTPAQHGAANLQILECWYLCHSLLDHIKENSQE